jgi:hypothetical protein
MSFIEILEKEIREWFDSDEPFTDFTRRIREAHPKDFKEWIETNPLPPERRDALNKMFISFLRSSTQKVNQDECRDGIKLYKLLPFFKDWKEINRNTKYNERGYATHWVTFIQSSEGKVKNAI